MEAGSSTMVTAAKLPVLNPGEFKLWKIRIEQYFLMTDYALWEVIVNGDSPLPKRTVNGVDQTYPPTTAEEKLARKNELKGRGTLLMALPNEHQLKFNTYKCAKTLMDVIEKRFGGSSSSNQNSQNVDFVSSNNSGNSNQAYGSNSANTDSMSDAIDLKCQMAMLTMRARRFLNKIGRKINANGFETIGFNKSKVECYNYHKKGHFTSECRAPKENRNREPAKKGPTNFALIAYTSSGSSSSSSSDSEVLIKQLRDNALTELRKKFEKAEKERDDLKLTLEKFRNSSKNLSKLLEIQVSDKFKTGVGFDSQVIDSHVFDSQENERGVVKKIENKKQAKYPRKNNQSPRDVTTAGPKAIVSNNKGNEANAVKASACWVWRPKQKVLDHVFRHNGASMNFKRFDYVDAQGRSKSIMAWVPIRAGFSYFCAGQYTARIAGKEVINSGCSRALD
ncbi:ribonuclease H-like domain-containing protein [Tanacetum coccineum]